MRSRLLGVGKDAKNARQIGHWSVQIGPEIIENGIRKRPREEKTVLKWTGESTIAERGCRRKRGVETHGS